MQLDSYAHLTGWGSPLSHSSRARSKPSPRNVPDQHSPVSGLSALQDTLRACTSMPTWVVYSHSGALVVECAPRKGQATRCSR